MAYEQDEGYAEIDVDVPIEGVEESELKNWVTTPSVLEEVTRDVLPLIDLVRTNRSNLENSWERFRSIYNMRREQFYYNGRSKLYIGAVKKDIDTLTRLTVDSLLSEPYLGLETDIVAWRTVGPSFLKHMLEKPGKIRDWLKKFCRQLYTIGTSCVKETWEKCEQEYTYRERGSREIKTGKMFTHYGPRYTVMDMKRVYVWPEWETSYDSLRLMFEDGLVTSSELRKWADEGVFSSEKVEEAIRAADTSLKKDREGGDQRQRDGLTDYLVGDELDLTCAWWKMTLPGRDYPEWVWIRIANSKQVLGIHECPWWYKHPNYHFANLFQEHDFFYGHGIPEANEMWQYWLNDTINQSMDATTFGLNAITAFDPAKIDDPDLIQIEPMAKWPIPPGDVAILRPPPQMGMEGMMQARWLLGVIQDQGDAPALVQGAPREGLGRAVGTATGTSQVITAAEAAIVDHVEDVENQTLLPLLQDLEIMAQQFMDEDILLRITGPDGVLLVQRIVSPTELALSTDLQWLASRRVREQVSRAQQQLNFLNIAVKIPPELQAQQGFTIDLKTAIQDVYAGMGLPNPTRIIKDLTQALPNMPPEMEEEFMGAGKLVLASIMDSPETHDAHIQYHLHSPNPTELVKMRKLEHIASHYSAKQQAMALIQAAQEKLGGGQQAALPAPPGLPVQEQPLGASPGEAAAGMMSQAGGAGGMAGGPGGMQ